MPSHNLAAFHILICFLNPNGYQIIIKPILLTVCLRWLALEFIHFPHPMAPHLLYNRNLSCLPWSHFIVTFNNGTISE